MLIYLHKVFKGKSFYLYKIFRYSQYLLILDTILILIYFNVILIYLTLFILFSLIFSLILLELTKSKFRLSISLSENEVIINDEDSVQTIAMNNILCLKIIFESYKGRSGLFTFWSEFGYNRIEIKTDNGQVKQCIFQIKNRDEYNLIYKKINLFKDKLPHKISVTRIFT